jgi:hypothetical protein
VNTSGPNSIIDLAHSMRSSLTQQVEPASLECSLGQWVGVGKGVGEELLSW